MIKYNKYLLVIYFIMTICPLKKRKRYRLQGHRHYYRGPKQMEIFFLISEW